MFGNVSKITLFEVKLLIKFHFILCAGANWDSKLDSKTIPALVLMPELRSKSEFFEVSHVAPFCVPFWFLCFKGSVLEAEYTPRLVLMNRI